VSPRFAAPVASVALAVRGERGSQLLQPGGAAHPLGFRWRSPFAASEDRNLDRRRDGFTLPRGWRSPFAASEGRNNYAAPGAVVGVQVALAVRGERGSQL
jgi:hypothetical protein